MCISLEKYYDSITKCHINGKDSSKITRDDLVEKLNITVNCIRCNLKKLIDDNLAKKVKLYNGEYWNIK